MTLLRIKYFVSTSALPDQILPTTSGIAFPGFPTRSDFEQNMKVPID
jgi:hypothetical protein